MLNEKLVQEIAEQVLKSFGGYIYLERGVRPEESDKVVYVETLTGLTVENNQGAYVAALREKIRFEADQLDLVEGMPITYRSPALMKLADGTGRIVVSLCLGFPTKPTGK